MALGMGVVFIFLTLLVFVLKVQAKLIAKFFSEKKVAQPVVSGSSSAQQVTKNDNGDVVAAITAAVIHHRK
jgi:oxaloacetate decarboxylase gamma subunit